MGQKVNPTGLRIGVIKPWNSTWIADKKHFSDNLVEDNKIRKFIKNNYAVIEDKKDANAQKLYAGISNIVIERAVGKVSINIYTSRPAILIGEKGSRVEEIKNKVQKIVAAGNSVNINIIEVKHADSDAQLVAEQIARDLENRASFRRAMKQAMAKAMKGGAKGIKTMVSGRLDGAEIARSEQYREGSIPLQTLRADIDYGVATANTTFGAIGVKVWIYKGEVLGKKPLEGGKQ